MDNEERRRIYGLETEYGLIFLDDDRPEGDSTLQVYPSLPEKVETWFLKTLAAACRIRHNCSHYNEERKVIMDMFARNGGRIYLDCGQHPETSTPECLTLRDAVLYDKAGERTLEEALKKTNRYIRRDGKRKSKRNNPFWLVKNNSHNEETYGSHENYLVRRQIPFREELADLLMPFLVTRQIFCGAGTVLETGFEISQRARFIKDDISALSRDLRNNEQSRAILHFKDSGRNSNDVTLADSGLWRRLHLILGDSNMSEYTAWLRLGTTALVLRMIEDRRLNEFIRIIQPVECFHQISRDPACRWKIRTLLKENPGGWRQTELTAAQIQEMYLKQAQNYLSGDSGKIPAENRREFQKIAWEWKKVLQKLKTDPILLKEEIDWVMKKNLLEEYKNNRGIDWNHPDLKVLDILYHHIDQDQGLYYLLEREGKARRTFNDQDIEKAKNRPPETRAKWRSAVIKLVEEKRIPYRGGWNEICLYPRGSNDEDEGFSCLDPFYSGPPAPDSKIKKPIEIP